MSNRKCCLGSHMNTRSCPNGFGAECCYNYGVSSGRCLRCFPELRFDGATYEHERDSPRLSRQYVLVWDVMIDGQWHTLAEISRITGCPEASISARFRDMRKDEFGGHTVDREHIEDGLHRYKLIPNKNGAGGPV